ncbi:hypothetical protein A2U01_0050686, partial [Trifolium medium]|nr:hypothetical protein [Trifolium medium]
MLLGEHYSVIQRRTGGQTEEEFTEMLHELDLPGKDWRYDSNGRRSRIIMSRCYAIYAIMRGKPIRVGRLIARSIKCMVTAAE